MILHHRRDKLKFRTTESQPSTVRRMLNQYELTPLESRPDCVVSCIVLTIILAFGVAIGISTGLPSSPMKHTNCTSKVLGLAQKGIVREVGGYYGAIYECTHMHGLSSIYGEASS